MNYEMLFTPFNIGKMEVKNRIVMAPMGLNSAHSDGTIDNDEIDYFEERARGGAGLIIIGCQFLTQQLAQGSMEGYLDRSHVIPQLTNLCEAVQKFGTKISAQLSCGTGKNAFSNYPQAGFEKRLVIRKTNNPKNIIVIGGGPGGMEAARLAAKRGHHVKLYEKDSELGGQLKSAATPDFKSQLRELVHWYKRQLQLYNVNVYLNSTITEDSPELETADSIIIATGAKPIMPHIKGIENTVDVISAHINPGKLTGNKIVYCGGGLSACDSALETAMNGKKVAIIEMFDEVAINDHFINKAALIPMLLSNGVELYTGCKVKEIMGNGVTAIKKDGTEIFVNADTVVSSFGMKKQDKIARAIDAKYHTKTRIIGDCNKVGKVGGAVREGFYAGVTID